MSRFAGTIVRRSLLAATRGQVATPRPKSATSPTMWQPAIQTAQTLLPTGMQQQPVRTHYYTRYSEGAVPPPPSFNKFTLNAMVHHNKIVLFIRGRPDKPRCRGSGLTLDILRCHGVSNRWIDIYDVTKCESLRHAMRSFSDSDELPQIYINGNNIGSSDELWRLHHDGEIFQIFEEAGIDSLLRMKKLVHSPREVRIVPPKP